MTRKTIIPAVFATAGMVVGMASASDSTLAAQTRPVIGAPGPGRLSNADERRFDALTFDHRTVRGLGFLPPNGAISTA